MSHLMVPVGHSLDRVSLMPLQQHLLLHLPLQILLLALCSRHQASGQPPNLRKIQQRYGVRNLRGGSMDCFLKGVQIPNSYKKKHFVKKWGKVPKEGSKTKIYDKQKGVRTLCSPSLYLPLTLSHSVGFRSDLSRGRSSFGRSRANTSVTPTRPSRPIMDRAKLTVHELAENRSALEYV